MSQPAVLVVDDEQDILRAIKMILEYAGYKVLTADNGFDALDMESRESPDIVLLDIKMPEMDGLEVLEKIKKRRAELPVVVLSGHGTIQTAVDALKLGAYDFLEKPPQRDRILKTIENALKEQELQQEVKYLRTQISEKYKMIGKSPAHKEILDAVQKVAGTNAAVLITGESGVGKELVARRIHNLSRRKNKPFIQVNCAAIPGDLIENELFGHEKGAYTGAGTRKIGKFEAADKGTIFLDEIGDMALSVQAKVLRALQEKEFQRVGGNEILHTDVRVISATNKNLPDEISKGTFREDLYFRLNVVPIHCPPLRRKKEDIPLLVNHFVNQFARENGIKPKTIAPDAVKMLQDYDWPGNIRELKNFIERLLIMSPRNTVKPKDISFDTHSFKHKEDETDNLMAKPTLQEFKDAAEREYILKKLNENNWNIKAAAENIDTPRSNLYKKMKQYGIDPSKERQ